MAATAPERSGTTRVDLPIEGMTCGACAARIERGLSRLDGVATASVNLAAERATVTYDPAVTGPPAFADKVAALGYAVGRGPADTDPDDELRGRLVAAAALTLPVLALAMVPALQYPGWQWLAAVLATPVVLWAGAGFHRAALAALAHRTATMDTLVSLGTLAAWGWSVAALLFAGAGDPTGMGAGAHVYFEVAAIIVVLVLFGRWLEQRARSRSGQACGGSWSWGQAPPWCCATGPRCRCRSRRWPSATGSWSGPARSWPPTGWSPTASPRSTGPC